MTTIYPSSLVSTLDSAAEAFFYHKSLPTSTRESITGMIVHRQCQTGVNAGYFVPYAAEIDTPLKLFSGEPLHTSFARRHILLIEAARMLNLLSMDDHEASHAYQVALQRMETMCYSKFCSTGECKALTVAFLRLLASDGEAGAAPRINTFLTLLADHRDRKGKWNGFPFFYTLLTLTEVADSQATLELQYAASTCKKQLAKNQPADPYSGRRQAILTQALARS